MLHEEVYKTVFDLTDQTNVNPMNREGFMGKGPGSLTSPSMLPWRMCWASSQSSGLRNFATLGFWRGSLLD